MLFSLSQEISFVSSTNVLQQKWSSCSWLLLREFVKLREEQKAGLEGSSVDGKVQDDLPLPAIPYVRSNTQIEYRNLFLLILFSGDADKL